MDKHVDRVMDKTSGRGTEREPGVGKRRKQHAKKGEEKRGEEGLRGAIKRA